MKAFTALPLSHQSELRGSPKSAVTKERSSIPLSPDVLQRFRATDDGWQTLVDAALNGWLIMQNADKAAAIKRGLELLDKLDQADHL